MRSISSRDPIVFTCVIFVIVDEYWVSKIIRFIIFFLENVLFDGLDGVGR